MSTSGRRDLNWPLQPGDVPNIASLVEDVAADIDSCVAEFGGTLVLCELREVGQDEFCRFAERLTQHWENGGITSLVIDAHPAAPFMGDLFEGNLEGFNEVLHYGISPEKVAVARDGVSGMWIPAGAPWTGAPESPEEPERSLRRFAESADRVLLLVDASDGEGLLGKFRELSQFQLVLGEAANDAVRSSDLVSATEPTSVDDQMISIDDEQEPTQEGESSPSAAASDPDGVLEIESFDNLVEAANHNPKPVESDQVAMEDKPAAEMDAQQMDDLPPSADIEPEAAEPAQEESAEMESAPEQPVEVESEATESAPEKAVEIESEATESAPEQPVEVESEATEPEPDAGKEPDLQEIPTATDVDGDSIPNFFHEANEDDPQEFRVGGGLRKQVMIPALALILIVVMASSYLYVQRYGWSLPGGDTPQLKQGEFHSGRSTRLPDRAELPYSEPGQVVSDQETVTTESVSGELDLIEAELQELAGEIPEADPVEPVVAEDRSRGDLPIQVTGSRSPTTVNAGMGLQVPGDGVIRSEVEMEAEVGSTVSGPDEAGIWINRDDTAANIPASRGPMLAISNDNGLKAHNTATSDNKKVKRRLESRERWRSALDHDGPFLVHVESYQDSALGAWSARQRGFARAGYQLRPTVMRGTTWYRLCVGPFPALEAATAFRDSLLDEAASGYCVIAVDREK